jgi:S-adenosylmethionine decarboxylase
MTKYRHLVGYIEGVWVSRAIHLDRIMNRIAERNDFTVVSSAFHQFEPHGTTGVLVLAESHFSAHTYPEDNKIYIDVFCCSDKFNPEFCAMIIEEEFSALRGTWQVIER